MGGDKMNDSSLIELTKIIMIVSVIALFIVMIFVVTVHLYSKWYWLRRRQISDDPNNPVREQRGLDASFLKTIQVIQFDPKDLEEELECAVCLSEVEEGEKARILPKCGHGFHMECIDMWFQSHSTCPICRNQVTGEAEISPEQEDSRIDGRNSLTDEANNRYQASLSEQASSSSISLQTYEDRGRPDLVIDIPSQGNEEEEQKTPVSCSGIRSLKRFTRFNSFSPRQHRQ